MSWGKPFTGKNDPRNGIGGRPKEHPLKGKVAFELWDALIRLLRMKRRDAEEYVKSEKCKVFEKMAWQYITDYETECFDRFCGRIPQRAELTGNDGAPLPMAVVYPIDFSKWKPDQIDKFIQMAESK